MTETTTTRMELPVVLTLRLPGSIRPHVHRLERWNVARAATLVRRLASSRGVSPLAVEFTVARTA